MNLEIKIDENLKESKIIISSPILTDEIKRITEFLSSFLYKFYYIFIKEKDPVNLPGQFLF